MVQTFEVVDRRGQNKSKEVTPIALVPDATSELADTSSWSDVEYVIALAQSQAGPIVIGRAVGLRADGRTFLADFIIPQRWPHGLDWTEHAKKRLDTFLGCQCKEHSPCSYHTHNIPLWMQQDSERFQRIAQEPPSPALEAMYRAEQARSRIVTPRG